MIASAAVASLFFAAGALAQYTNCPAASDFIVVQNVAAGSTTVNSGGLVGGEHVNYTFGANGATVTPRGDGSAAGSLYWFFKFDVQECYDASGYNAIQFDVTAPVGSTFSMTWTTHLANCSSVLPTCAGTTRCVRGPDSKYIPITDYITPSGSVQSVRIPFADFLPNTDGTGLTDFYHIKDFTFIGFSPNTTATQFVFNNIVLKAGCTAGLPSPPSDRPGVATKPANQSTDVSPLPGMKPRSTTAAAASATGAAATGGASASSTASASRSPSAAVGGPASAFSTTFVGAMTSIVAILFAGAVAALA